MINYTLGEQHKVYLEFDNEVHLYFLYFLSLKLQSQANFSAPVKQVLSSNVPLLENKPQDKNKRREGNAKKHEKRLVSLVPELFQHQALAFASLATIPMETFLKWTYLNDILCAR